MDGDLILDQVLEAVGKVLQFFPVGSELAKGLALAYEAIVELRTIQETVNLEDLRAFLAKRLGQDVADIMGDRFGRG